MTNLDLLDYSNSSQKIPTKTLDASLRKENVHPWRISLAHYMDFCVVVTMTIGMSKAFSLSIAAFLPTWSLREAYASINSNYSIALFPFVLFSYYFFSYFLNNGQSWGFHANKIRISMKERSFRSSFRHATHSAIYCMTGGLSSFWSPLSKRTMSHDYLYRQLVEIKDWPVVNLMTLTQEDKSSNAETSEVSKLAA